MALKDRQLTLDDFRALKLDADPLLYVAADWKGVITDVFDVAGITLAGKIWVVSQFFTEVYYRRWVMNCLIQATIDLNLAVKPFFIAYTQAYFEAVNAIGKNDYSLMATLEAIVLEEVRTAGKAMDGSKSPKDYARLMWAFRWACSLNFDETCWQTISDTIVPYSTKDTGWGKCKTKMLEIIDIHP